MLKQQRTNIFLVAICLLLLGVWFYDRDSLTTEEVADREAMLFDGWREQDVAQLTIERAGRSLKLRRIPAADEQGDWQLAVDGREAQADPQAVEQFLVALQYAMFERKVTTADEETMGLSEPRATLALDMGRWHYRLRIGGSSPRPVGGAYVHVSGGSRDAGYYAIKKSLVDELLINLDALRSARLQSYLSPHLKSLAVERSDQPFSLQRGAWGGRTAGAFLLERPGLPPVRADRRILDAWFTALGRLEALRFLRQIPKETDGTARLTMSPRDDAKPPAILDFGGEGCSAPEETLVVRRQPHEVAACVSSTLVKRLLGDPAELEDHHLIGTASGDIMELSFASAQAGVEVEAARKDDGWILRRPSEGAVAKAAMARLVDDLLRAEGERLTIADGDLDRWGLKSPQATIKIIALPERAGPGKAEERIEELLVGHIDEAAQKAFVKRSDDGAVFEVSADTANSLLPRPGALRSTAIYDLPISTFRKLRIDCAGRRQQLSRQTSGSWTLLLPKASDLKPDMALANDLAGLLRKLAAVRWVADKAAPSHRLAQPFCTIEAEVEEAGTRRTLKLELGAEARGGYYARYDDDRAVFVAPRAIAALASQWLLDRAALLVVPAQIERVTLEAKDRLTVERRGDDWLIDGKPSPTALQIRDALSQLVAEAVIARGPAAPADGFAHPLLTIEVLRPGVAPLTMHIGRADVWRSAPVYLMRRQGLDLTFAVSRARVQPLLDAL